MEMVLQWTFLHTYLCTGVSSAPYNQILDAVGLLGDPVVKTLPSNTGDSSSIPGWGAKIPHASRLKNQNIKQKQCCKILNKDFKNGPHQKIYHIKKICHDITTCPKGGNQPLSGSWFHETISLLESPGTHLDGLLCVLDVGLLFLHAGSPGHLSFPALHCLPVCSNSRPLSQ